MAFPEMGTSPGGELENHGMVWVGRDVKDHLIPAPCHGLCRRICSPPRASSGFCYPGLLTCGRSGKIRIWLGCPPASQPGQGTGLLHRHPAKASAAGRVCPGPGSLPSFEVSRVRPLGAGIDVSWALCSRAVDILRTASATSHMRLLIARDDDAR